MALAIALCAQVRIPLPFTPIPVTLQTLAVLVAPFAVGPARATAGALAYTVLGLMGAPLFAITLGPTFGYILGFSLAPWAMARFASPAIAVLAGTLAVYIPGVFWLALWAPESLGYLLVAGVAPFLPADAVKAAIAYRYARWKSA